MGMNKHDILEQKMCKELDMLEEKYRNTPGDMNDKDLERIDALYHALKSKATYDAMKEAEEYNDMPGYSGARGRDPMTGRYVSRDEGPYMDHSGYYPPMNQYRYPRW